MRKVLVVEDEASIRELIALNLQMAGWEVWRASAGFLVTGVGLPLLGVAALGSSRSEGLFDLSSKVNRPYAYFFTCLLYLTIGPFLRFPGVLRPRLP